MNNSYPKKIFCLLSVAIASLVLLLNAITVEAQPIKPKTIKKVVYMPKAPFRKGQVLPKIGIGTFNKQYSQNITLKRALPLNSVAVENLRYVANNSKNLKLDEFAKRFPSKDDFLGMLYTAVLVNGLDKAISERNTHAALPEQLKEPQKKDKWMIDSKKNLDDIAIKAFSKANLQVTAQQLDNWRQLLPADLKTFLSSMGSSEGPVQGQGALSIHVGGRLQGQLEPSRKDAEVNQMIQDFFDQNKLPDCGLCSSPFASGKIQRSVSDNFTWDVTGIPYPCHCGWSDWNPIPKCRTCYKTITLTFSYYMGCQADVQISCCGGEASGSCTAETCAYVSGVGGCAGCSGGISAGIGMVPSPTTGDICSYGLPILMEVNCYLWGENIFDVIYPVSPYQIIAACPPDQCCPNP